MIISEYKIITADTFDELEQAVNLRLKEGWQCRGELICISDEMVSEFAGSNLAQVMVKPDIEQ